MSKVLVDRELLDKLASKLDGADFASYGWGNLMAAEVREVLAQPAETEGSDVVGFLYKNNGEALTAADMDSDTFALMSRSDFDGEVEKLVRQADHLAAISAVTAERDRLREALEDLLGCPANVVQATVPNAGIEAAPPYQVVLDVSVSLTRWNKAKAALAAKEA